MATALKLHTNSGNETAVMHKVDAAMQEEDERLNQIYEAMGWGDLPYRLKFEIALDIVGFYDELRGLYSTRDPFVLARRKRVLYWINNYRNGNCSVDTVVKALKVNF